MNYNNFDRTLSSGDLQDLNIKDSSAKKSTRNKKSKVDDGDLMFEKVIRPTEIVRKFYVDDEFNTLIASPLKPEKKTWLTSS